MAQFEIESNRNLETLRPLFQVMEHKGIRYELLQSVSPAGWRWVAHTSLTEPKMGFSRSKQLAEFAAQSAIDKALSGRSAERIFMKARYGVSPQQRPVEEPPPPPREEPRPREGPPPGPPPKEEPPSQ
jgi:hypothetical protein